MSVKTLKESEARDLLEIIESSYKKASTIFCSQFEVAGWYHKIGESTLADAICDRIVHDSYTIVIGGKDSMRKKKGIENKASHRDSAQTRDFSLIKSFTLSKAECNNLQKSGKLQAQL